MIARVTCLVVLLALAGCRSEGAPFVLESRVAADEGSFKAGIASAEFTPPDGYALGGYGGGKRRVQFPFYYGLGWPGRLALAWHQFRGEDGPILADMLERSYGTHDPLLAKALVFVPEKGPPFALARIDTIEMTAEIHDRALEKVKDLGFRKDTVIVSATHTHSGPGHFVRAPLARLMAMDNFRPEIEAAIADAVAKAIRDAHARARPAALGFGRALDDGAGGKPRAAKNRRAKESEGALAPDDIDHEMQVLLVEDARDRRPIAVVANYGVHPTVLGTQNLYWSSDLVGPFERALAARGGEGLFLNGAEGDVGPEFRGGMTATVAEGDALAQVASAALAAGIRTSPRARFDGAVGARDMGDPEIFFAAGRERFWSSERGAGCVVNTILALPANALIWVLGFTNLRVGLGWNASAGVVADLSGYGDRTSFRFGALRIRSGGEDVALLAIPGEPCHDVGLDLKERAKKRGATRAWILSLADDALSYVASRKEYFRGSYEATMTLFGPDTADKVTEASEGLLGGLGYPAR